MNSNLTFCFWERARIKSHPGGDCTISFKSILFLMKMKFKEKRKSEKLGPEKMKRHTKSLQICLTKTTGQRSPKVKLLL